MKKLIIITLSLVPVLFLCSCGKKIDTEQGLGESIIYEAAKQEGFKDKQAIKFKDTFDSFDSLKYQLHLRGSSFVAYPWILAKGKTWTTKMGKDEKLTTALFCVEYNMEDMIDQTTKLMMSYELISYIDEGAKKSPKKYIFNLAQSGFRLDESGKMLMLK